MSSDSDEDGLLEEDDDESEESIDEKKSKKSKKKKKKGDKKPKLISMIDDAAEESGDEANDDDDEEEEDEDAPNDYIADGFVVDEDEDEEEDIRPKRRRRPGDLEDSDDDDDDDDEDDDDDRVERRKKKRVRKLRDMDRLDEDDLALINEAQDDGGRRAPQRMDPQRATTVMAHNEADLRRSLFYDSGGEDDGGYAKPKPKKSAVDRYDEDGMDDFIEDDIGDQRMIQDSENRQYDGEGGKQEVSEAQLNEASEIFGSEYLDFMAAEERNDDNEDNELFGDSNFKERGVGVDLGVDSDEEVISDDDDDLFGDDDDENDTRTAAQKAEALKLKREKRELKKAERRKQVMKKRADRRKAQLRKAFEPVQLVENFCTDRDDEIRRTDAPERFFDRSTPFHGSEDEGMTAQEKEEAMWIMSRIQPISAEFASASYKITADSESRQKAILESIVNALRYIHRDKLEPAFIRHYRADSVTSPAVRNNLDAVMDEDAEWGRMTAAHDKVDSLLHSLTAASDADEAGGREEEEMLQLKKKVKDAQNKLDDTANQESEIKVKIEALGKDKKKDDDDELFGADDDDDDDDDDDEAAQAKKKEKEEYEKHLKTIQDLLQERAERVTMLQSQLQAMETRMSDTLNSLKPSQQVVKKVCRDSLWSKQDYGQYLSMLSDERHIIDLNGYLNLIKEGNDAVRKKEMPTLGQIDKKNERKRSRRFDRDYYRTCVADGLRTIAYRFLLAPNRVGIKLEDNLINGGFDFTKTMPGEDKDDAAGDPLQWVAPIINNLSPSAFASDLVGSGELVLLSSAPGSDDVTKDPLRGCRYVAALELSNEPRVRRHLRNIFRRCAVMTTKPTKKGLDTIDAFHDYYGLHLIRNKPIKDHFPMDERESDRRKANLSPAECNELDAEMQKRQKASCLQYVNIMKAEQTNDVSVHIHMPLKERDEDWYRPEKKDFAGRDSQDISPLMSELKKVYLPPDGDSEEWNEERIKILRFALTNFLLPQFEAETRKELREAAIKLGVEAAGESLYEMAMVGPYRPRELASTENRFLSPTGDLSLVGVCCSLDGRDPCYLASVNDRGELNDHLAIPSGTKIDSRKMREKVITFLLQWRPAAVLVGTSGGFDARFLTRKLNDIIAEATKRWYNRDIQGEDEDDDAFQDRQKSMRQIEPKTGYEDEEELEWKCNADLVEDSISQLFGRSIRGKKEFPDAAVNLRSAISIARYGKDPLGEITYTWTVASDVGVFGTELLYVNVHPMQQLLPKTMLLREYERALCHVVAQVGVDINQACQFDHLRGLLTFVPGLGPRKAANLKANLTHIGGLVSGRKELLEKRLMGPCVYNNAVAFLRIREVDQLSHQFLHPLDDTRLHPDVYHRNNWAVKIAVDALEREDAKNRESAANQALRDVMDNSLNEVGRLFRETKAEWESRYGPTFNIADWNPRINVPHEAWRDKVEELDLEAFANMIEQNQQGRWHSHLQMIKWEFRLPFADPRKPMEPLSGEKLFHLITGETDQSLRPGKEVTGKITKNGDFGSNVKIDGNIQAFIPLRNLADEHVDAAEDIVQIGQVVIAVITEVRKDFMSVNLSMKLEDLKKSSAAWDRPHSLPPLDDHFDRISASKIEDDAYKERMERLKPYVQPGDTTSKPAAKRVVSRICAHPAFRNAKQDEVDRELKEAGEMMVGEALIRPSSKNSDSLAVHWVVRVGSVKVVEVLEEDKDTVASIGNILKIKDETYGSIDELLGRYVAPLNDYVEELTTHRKFIDLPEDEVDDKLKELKKANPKSIPYHFCWLEMHPGYASLRFMLSRTPRSHNVGISPKGFVWGKTHYSSLEKLINDFKKNPRGAGASSSRPSSSQNSESGTKDGGSSAKPSRWGAKSSQPPPPSGGWQPPPPSVPPAPPVGQGNWGASQASGSVSGGWSESGSQRPPPPNLPPPPRGFQPPPPMGHPPPPNFAKPPPPTFGQPPPPGPPPKYQARSGNQPNYPYRPPPPPGAPPPGYPPPRVQH